MRATASRIVAMWRATRGRSTTRGCPQHPICAPFRDGSKSSNEMTRAFRATSAAWSLDQRPSRKMWDG